MRSGIIFSSGSRERERGGVCRYFSKPHENEDTCTVRYKSDGSACCVLPAADGNDWSLACPGMGLLVSLLCDDLGHCISDGGGAIKGYCVALSDVRFYVMYVRSVLHPTGDTSTSTTSRSTSCRARDTRYEIRSAAWYSCVLCAYRTYE